jgi:hypothetical protein
MRRYVPSEETLLRTEAVTPVAAAEARARSIPDAALNNWLDTKLNKYIKNEMGTPEDPVRALAERGILHVDPAQLNYRLDAYGKYPQPGQKFLAQSDAAKIWEGASDNALASAPARQWLERADDRAYAKVLEENPWLSKVPPETPVNQVSESGTLANDLGFDHIMDVLREDLTTGRIRPEQLSKINMEQAVRRTAEYDQELAAKINSATAAAREGLPVYKEYPEGYRWIELNRPGSFAAESDSMGHSVRGYEPPKGHPDWVEGSGDAGSSGYGHGGWEAIKRGDAKVYSLVDSKGAPHATVEVKTKGVLTDDDFGENDTRIVEGRNNDFGERGYITTDNQFFEVYADAVAHEKIIQKPTTQELQEPPSITQIKGKGNRAPNEEYLPYIQDFVKGGQWSDVGDLRNTGLRDLQRTPEIDKYLKEKGVEVPRYLDEGEYQKYESDFLMDQLYPKNDPQYLPPQTPEGMAGGGLVRMGLGGPAKIAKAAAAKAGKKVLGAADEVPKGVLPVAERDANLAKMRESSKVPQRLYHGTTDDIQKFDPSKAGKKTKNLTTALGTFLSDNPKEASRFAEQWGTEGGNVMPVFAQIQNPYQMPYKEFDELAMGAWNRMMKDPSYDPDAVVKWNDIEGAKRAAAAVNKHEPDALQDVINRRNELMAQGHDAVIVNIGGNKEVIVFDPAKIKSATGNRGTYDTTDPDISKAAGGAIHMAGGGAIKAALAKLGKFASESDLAAIKEAGRAAYEQEASIRAAKNADVEKKLQSMPPRSKAANMEMGIYHPVGGGLKLSKPFEAMHSTRVANPKVVVPKVKILTPEDLYRQRVGFFPLVGDKADTGTFLTHIGEKELEVPVGLGGGPRYMDANLNPTNPSQSSAWESGTGRTTALGGQAAKAAESGNPVYGVYTAGSGTNTDFNIMGANALLQQLNQSKLTKKAEKAFDKAMREEGTEAFPPMPDWPGIRSAQLEDMLLDKSNGILRTKLFDTMGKENFQSMGFPDIPATRKAIMDPQLYNTQTNEAGFRIAKMDPTGRIIENPLNPSDYPTAMAGELEGQLNMGMDYKDLFSTHFTNRRLLSKPESGDYYSFSRAHPIQYADQEWLDKIMKAQEAKNKLIKTGKYAKGGEVKPKGGLAAATKSSHRND